MLNAQDTINLPPDYYGEALREAYAAWENTGWVRNTSGALEPNIKYVTDGASPRAYLKRDGAMSLVLASIDTSMATLDTLHRLDISFDGEFAQHPDPIVRMQREYHRNFHLPWCGPGGKTMVHGYRWMMYPEIYPKIDMYIYCGSRGQKIMFVIRPEGDPANLKMTFSGHDDMDIDVLGNLKLLLQNEWVVLPEAVAYQYDAQNNIYDVNWTAQYQANTGTGEVGFTFDQYDRYKPLVLLIGPPPMMGGPSVFTNGVCWSTYYGGDGDDFIFGSRIDVEGNYCITGQTFSSIASFPVENGSVYYQASPAVVAAKFDDSDHLRWSTIFGCSSGTQLGLGCARPLIQVEGEFFIGGRVDGADLAVPLTQPSGRYVDTSPGMGPRGFLASFTVQTGALFWSTYFGGVGSTVYDLDFDAFSNLYVCGSNSGSLPQPTELTPPAGSANWPYSNNGDAFIAKLNPGFKVWWSTYIGGSGIDEAYSVRVGAGRVVVAGRVQSPFFQTLTAGDGQAHNFSTSSYTADIFLEEFSLSGVQQWGSYFSYGGNMGFQGLALDNTNGDIFLVGSFLAGQNNMPVSTNAPWYQSPNSAIFEKGFIWQLGADHVRKYSTFVTGNNGSNHLRCAVLDAQGQLFAAGISWATSMSTQCAGDLYCTPTPLGHGDAYIIAVTAEHWRSWLTYFGGDQDLGDHAEMIRTLALKGTDRVYAAGYTYSPYDELNGLFFPLHDELGGAWWDSELDATNGGDAFLAAFCTGDILTGFTGIAEVRDGAPMVYAHLDLSGILHVFGLGAGTHIGRLFDITGRLVDDQQFNVSADGEGCFHPPCSAVGAYIVQFDELRGRLILPLR